MISHVAIYLERRIIAIPYLLHTVLLSSTITELGHNPLTSVTLIASFTTEPASLFANDAQVI